MQCKNSFLHINLCFIVLKASTNYMNICKVLLPLALISTCKVQGILNFEQTYAGVCECAHIPVVHPIHIGCFTVQFLIYENCINLFEN